MQGDILLKMCANLTNIWPTTSFLQLSIHLLLINTSLNTDDAISQERLIIAQKNSLLLHLHCSPISRLTHLLDYILFIAAMFSINLLYADVEEAPTEQR